MQRHTILPIMVVFYISLTAAFYTGELEKVDIDNVVANPEAMETFTGCFLDRVACGPGMDEVKKLIPEAIKSACEKCSPKQKSIGKKYIEVLKEKSSEDYESFKKKFDQDGKHFDSFMKALSE